MAPYRTTVAIAGGTFLHGHPARPDSRLLVEQIDALREAVRTVRARTPFHIDAWVVLPEHLHCIWTLPPDDDDYSGPRRAVRASFGG